MSTHTEMESQAAILCIWTGLERDDSEALQNIATCGAVLHNRVVKVYRSLLNTTNSVAGFDVDIAVAELKQSESAVPKQAFIDVAETGRSKGR